MSTNRHSTFQSSPESKRSWVLRRWLRVGVQFLMLAAAAAAVIYKMKFSPIPVRAHRVAYGPVVAEVLGIGTLEARVKTTISPRIQERLLEVLVDQGDSVKAGQLLARLDDGELKGLVEVSEAGLSAAKATEVRVRVDEARAQAVEQQARQDHQRTTDLVRTKVSSQAELDKAIERLQVAESDWHRARAATVEAQQQVQMAEKSLIYQRERFKFTRILSPYDGLVTRRDRDPGGVVVPGSSILQLVSTNELWVSAWVDETASAALAQGRKARVVFRSDPTKSYSGDVARLGLETDRETREFLVDVRVRELPPNWTLGQRAEVFIEAGQKTNVWVVPTQFVLWRDGEPGVFVAKHGKAEWRHLTLGLRGLETVEVVQGLSEDEHVILPIKPQQPSLKPGQRVEPK